MRFERGRTFHHRNGQLESDIFDRDMKIKDLEAKLKIATEALEKIERRDFSGYIKNSVSIAREAIAKIKGEEKHEQG